MTSTGSNHEKAKHENEHSHVHSVQTSNSIELAIEGASCGSCVAKIEKALAAVPGVTNAEMNLSQRTATVAGTANSSALIKALQDAGYNAAVTSAESDEDTLDAKEKADLEYYKQLMRKTWLALALGIPLMAYALVTGEMSVTTNTERIAWLVVGILTAGVLYFSGRHFFVGAWKSFLNHSANMDTLIAEDVFLIPLKKITDSIMILSKFFGHRVPVCLLESRYLTN